MSSSSLLRRSSCLALFLFLASCQGLRTREDIRKTPPPTTRPPVTYPQQPTPQAPPMETDEEEVTEAPPPPPAPVIPSMPKIGIILGGGGAKTYAHIGFLHELMRAKVPVHAIGGIEFAAPMAALYANKEQANDVEWQMFKLKEEDVLKKSLLGGVSKNNEVTVLKDFIGSAFSRAKAEDFRIPFACPSYNLKKNQIYLMNRGPLDQLMYLCMAYPPFFKSYQGSIAGVRDVTSLANYLRQKGANYIVFVNVLQTPGGSKPYTADVAATDNILWSEVAGQYNKAMPGVDVVVSLDTSNYGMMDFDKRREIMSKGADSAARQLKGLTRKWGL
ncbi:alpha/beta hydrolase [Bdellovibrio sp. 22V]|uniref:patatin-like phospholipase family protein n=1 Tax=Bdellovibrio TaxID=958 RepID=UPI002543B364|nr:patatin-like phospholipase family protein [Bdellovibrio sp. 22V]WII70800.1 alpha/beta hydrolase [Bdellovibrio sp. 22V]